MSFGVDSFGVGSFGAPVAAAGGGYVTHTATGGIAAADAAVSGAASRTGAAITHTATGTLIASNASVAGSASRTGASAYDYRITVIGDSNASGRGSFSQTNSASNAYLYDVSGSIVALSDPWDAGTDTYSALSDSGSAGGSYVQHLADLFNGAGKSTLWIPANKGGTTSTSWAYSTSTTTCYGAMKARIDAAGGTDIIIIHLGANDAIDGMSQATFTSNMNAIIGNLATDFPAAKIYLQKIHHNSSATTTNIDNIRAAVDDIWANNTNVYRGADLEGISTGVHYGQTGNTTTCTSELNEVALRTYNALMSVAHTSSGAVVSGSSSVSGAASRTAAVVTHSATADLSAGSATIDGSANRIAAPVTHTATGSLIADSAAVSGYDVAQVTEQTFNVYGLRAQFRRQETEEEKRMRREAQGIIRRVTKEKIDIDEEVDDPIDAAEQIKQIVRKLEEISEQAKAKDRKAIKALVSDARAKQADLVRKQREINDVFFVIKSIAMMID